MRLGEKEYSASEIRHIEIDFKQGEATVFLEHEEILLKEGDKGYDDIINGSIQRAVADLDKIEADHQKQIEKKRGGS